MRSSSRQWCHPVRRPVFLTVVLNEYAVTAWLSRYCPRSRGAGARLARGLTLKNIRNTFGMAHLRWAIVYCSDGLWPGIATWDSVNWDAVAACESGGNWAINTG